MHPRPYKHAARIVNLVNLNSSTTLRRNSLRQQLNTKCLGRIRHDQSLSSSMLRTVYPAVGEPAAGLFHRLSLLTDLKPLRELIVIPPSPADPQSAEFTLGECPSR
jgi:hypothetical protein